MKAIPALSLVVCTTILSRSQAFSFQITNNKYSHCSKKESSLYLSSSNELLSNFKEQHNQVLSSLVKYCQNDRKQKKSTKKKLLYKWDDEPWKQQGQLGRELNSANSPIQRNEPIIQVPRNIPTNIFLGNYQSNHDLSTLLQNHQNVNVINPLHIYISNELDQICQSFQASCGGLIPDANVIPFTPTEALTVGPVGGYGGEWSLMDFTLYFFDFTSISESSNNDTHQSLRRIMTQLSAALLAEGRNKNNNHEMKHQTIALGYRLKGNKVKDLMEQELEIGRALSKLAKTRGMRTRHVLEDPEKYSIPSQVPKIISENDCEIFQTWMVLEADDISTI